MDQSFKFLVHLVIQSLADSTRILYWRKWKSFTIRNNQAKDGQESTFYMATPPLISVRLFSLFGLWKGESFKPSTLFTWPKSLWLLFISKLKKILSENKYMSRSSLGSTIYQCLQQIPKEDYLSAFPNWVKRLQKCVSVKGEYFEDL